MGTSLIFTQDIDTGIDKQMYVDRDSLNIVEMFCSAMLICKQ